MAAYISQDLKGILSQLTTTFRDDVKSAISPVEDGVVALQNDVDTVSTDVFKLSKSVANMVETDVKNFEGWVAKVTAAVSTNVKNAAGETAKKFNADAENVKREIITEVTKSERKFYQLLVHVNAIRRLENAGMEFTERFDMCTNSIDRILKELSPNENVASELYKKIAICFSKVMTMRKRK